MTTKMPGAGPILAALVFALSVFAFSLFVWRSFGGDTPLEPQGYRVHVLFGPSGAQLVENADVRISGVSVGKVKRVEARGLRTDAELELKSRYAPLPADARAIIRTKTLLGETFVALTPGTRRAPKVPEGGALGLGQVEETQGVDEVLSTFDGPTRKAFRDLLGSVALSLEGRSAGLNTTLGNLAPTSEAFGDLVDTLRARDADVRGVVRDTGTVFRALARQDDAIGELMDAGDQALGATAARDRELEQTVRAMPAFLREARATLREAEGAAGDAAPALRALRPVAPLIRPALRDTERLLPRVAATGRRLNPVIDAAKTGLPAAGALVRQAPAAMRVLDVAGRQLVPVLQTLDAYKADVVPSLAKLAAVLQGQVDGQHVLRVLMLLFNENVLGYEKRATTNRANPYDPPNASADLRRPLRSLDCSNTTSGQDVPPVLSDGPPPCLEAQPWTLRGKTAVFPGVEPDR